MRIVIAGDDEIAFRLAEQLMDDHAISLVTSEDAGPRVERLDVDVLVGAITAIDTHRRVEVDRSDLFIACSEHDEHNIVACAIAKRLGAKQAICFVVRSDIYSASVGSESLSESLGIDSVIRPAEQLAREILRIVAVPGALDVEAFVGGKVRLFRHVVEEGAPITNSLLMHVGIPSEVVLVMARRGDDIFIPKGNTQFRPGDKVTAMGEPAAMNLLLFKYLKAESAAKEVHRATVVGGGEVGLGVALGLEDAGWQVKVIESDRRRCEEISRVLNSLVLFGDGSDLHLLEEEDIGDSSVLISVTSNDEKNLLVSLLAKQLGVRRIVTRASRQSYERLFERVGIDVIRSASGAAVRTIVKSIVESHAELLAELEHGDAMVLEVELPETFEERPISDLSVPEFVIIGAILREEDVIIPKGSDVIQASDRLLVFCTREFEDEARNFFVQHGSR